MYGAINALWAELLLAFQDGSSQSIVTDETWKVGDSQIVKSSFFDGETVDFRTPQNTDLNTLPCAQKYDFSVRF